MKLLIEISVPASPPRPMYRGWVWCSAYPSVHCIWERKPMTGIHSCDKNGLKQKNQHPLVSIPRSRTQNKTFQNGNDIKEIEQRIGCPSSGLAPNHKLLQNKNFNPNTRIHILK